MLNKVLFVTEHYCDMNPAHGETNTISILIEPFRDLKFANEVATFYYDDIAKKAGYSNLDMALIKLCNDYKPDLIFFSPMGIPPEPSKEALNSLHSPLTKIAMIRWDSISYAGDIFNRSWFPYLDYEIFMDSTIGNLKYTNNKQAIQGVSSFNGKYFYDRKLVKDIDVCFVGWVGRDQNRGEYINFLRTHSINIHVAGGQRTNRISWDEYATIISRSKISLNFS